MKNETQQIGNNEAKTVAYSYDKLGNMKSVGLQDDGTTNSSEITNYTYDVASRVTAILRDTQQIASMNYNSLSKTQTTFANGNTTSYNYDTPQRLNSTNNSNEALQDYAYSYDSNSQITSNG